MEKLFRPGKWLVLFCGVFLLLYGVLQYVSNARLKEEASLLGKNIFTWTWRGVDWRSEAEITNADVVQKSANDAVVKIKGRQTLLVSEDRTAPEVVDCSATLTLYRTSIKNRDYWVLGKVEFP